MTFAQNREKVTPCPLVRKMSALVQPRGHTINFENPKFLVPKSADVRICLSCRNSDLWCVSAVAHLTWFLHIRRISFTLKVWFLLLNRRDYKTNVCIIIKFYFQLQPAKSLLSTIMAITAFHVPFWLSHILVYLFYLCTSLWINKQENNSVARKEHVNAVYDQQAKCTLLWNRLNSPFIPGSGGGGSTRPLLRDGVVEEFHEDRTVRSRPKVWTRGQNWKSSAKEVPNGRSSAKEVPNGRSSAKEVQNGRSSAKEVPNGRSSAK